MLRITFKVIRYDQSGKPNTYALHLPVDPASKPFQNVPAYWDEIQFISADGAELAYLRRHVTGLHDLPEALTVRWTGDDAQFIYENFLSHLR